MAWNYLNSHWPWRKATARPRRGNHQRRAFADRHHQHSAKRKAKCSRCFCPCSKPLRRFSRSGTPAQNGSLSVILQTTAMKSKSGFKKLELLARLTAMILPTAFVTACCAHPASQLAPTRSSTGILRLSPGETYKATKNETWHSHERYQACERDAINAVAALKQRTNH